MHFIKVTPSVWLLNKQLNSIRLRTVIRFGAVDWGVVVFGARALRSVVFG